jgi:hypothetical protein
MLRVANHERGYSCEQQEDLEAIMPAIVQALQRESSEKKRERMEAMLFALNSINQIIHSTLKFDQIMKKMILEESQAIGWERISFLLESMIFG